MYTVFWRHLLVRKTRRKFKVKILSCSTWIWHISEYGTMTMCLHMRNECAQHNKRRMQQRSRNYTQTDLNEHRSVCSILWEPLEVQISGYWQILTNLLSLNSTLYFTDQAICSTTNMHIWQETICCEQTSELSIVSLCDLPISLLAAN